MKRSKRPRMKKNRDRDYYQIPKDCEKEIQRSCEFVNKLKEFGDKKIFIEFLEAMKSYQLKSLTYIELKTKVFFILRDHEDLLQDFKQLLLELAAEEEKKNQNPKKSDVERTVEFLNKLEALGNGIHSAFLNKLVFPDDIPTLVSQLGWILRDHASLKQEFRTFLIDSGLLKEYEYVTPSYMMRHEAEEVSSSSVLNGTYVSVGHNGSSKVRRILSSDEESMNDLEDKLLKKDMYFKALESVVEYGKSYLLMNEKPPVGFKEVVRRFYKDWRKKVPRGFKTEPKLALQGILPSLQIKLSGMSLARTLNVIKIIRSQTADPSEQSKKIISFLSV